MEVNNSSLDKYRLSKLLDEMNKDEYDMTDYKSKVKDVCFICGKICNPKKDYNYYVRNGNACQVRCFNSKIAKHNEEMRIKKEIRIGEWKDNAKKRKIKI